MSKRIAGYVGTALLILSGWMPILHVQEAVAASNDEPATEEEPSLEHGKINTPDASPVDPGHVEIESSYSYTHARHFWDNASDDHPRGLAQKQVLGLSVTGGVVENVDVTVSGGYAWLKDEENDPALGSNHGHNLGDLEISGRYRFFESKEHHLELAYIAGFTMPTGSSSASREEMGTSQDFWSFNQTLVASKDWGKWTANADIGYALPLDDKRENARGAFNADVAVGYQVLPWLQPEIELKYNRSYLAGEDDKEVLAVTVGLLMPLNNRLRVNAGVQQGFWGRNTDKETTLYTAVKLAF